MKYRLQCNFCSETFVHVGDSFPNSCPHCGAYVGLDGKPEVTLPFLSSKANKSPDDVYRVMQESAQHRAYLAAEASGRPVSEMSGLLQTNMRDNLREGDTSFVPTKLEHGMTASFGNAGAPGVDQNLLNGVRSGPSPNAGAAQMPVMNKYHRENAGRIIAAGRQGKHG
jgi:hypothetical protein